MNPINPYTPNCEIKPGMDVPPGMQRQALIVEYNGVQFFGFQKQASTPKTVQGHLESAISFVADESVTLVCAGRTDSGVHATAQVVHFDTLAKRPSKAWIQGVNTRLPAAIRVKQALQVPLSFHSRFSALSRTYKYILHVAPVCPAILVEGVTWTAQRLDVKAMHNAAQILVGEHDFSSFRSSQCQANSPFRSIKSIQIEHHGVFVVLTVTANAFLHHMVRNIVGALLEVGKGAKNAEWLLAVLNLKDRTKAPPTAPPFGLYLVGVEYPSEYSFPLTVQTPLFLY